jgi:hypothetical protein
MASYQTLISEYSSNFIQIVKECPETLYGFTSKSTSSMISILDEVKMNEKFLWLYDFVFESDFLPYASYALMGCSTFCLLLVLQNVKISYPDLIEESGSSLTEEIGVKANNLSPIRQGSSRADRSDREDLRSFATNKVI